MSDVFTFNCDSKRGHRLLDVHDEFRNEVVLVCERCGQSLPLRTALARTPIPTTVTTVTWPSSVPFPGSSTA